jgi:hypothetical protein
MMALPCEVRIVSQAMSLVKVESVVDEAFLDA